MAYDIGTARGVIEMEYNGRGVDQAEEDLTNLEKGGKRAGVSLNQAANAAGAAGLVIAGGLAVAVNAAANFEQRMSAVKAVSGANADEMDRLSAKALQLGKDTAFSATESASAIEELVKAGLSVEDVLNGAADATVALAAAGEVDLPTAAKIASNAMNQFNLNAEDMPRVADLIAGAANASAIDVGEFGESLQQAGAVANLAGVDFEDTATAIALMGNAGIAGSDAGTSLKSMLSRLQPVPKKQKEEMERLGLITKDGSNQFYDAQGNIKSFSEISGVLADSLKGMSKQQKQAALQVLFGSDAIRAAAILANEGSKGFDKMSASLNKVKAADVAATRMDNLTGRMEEMTGSLETVGIAIGTALLPVAEAVVGVVTDLANAFLELDDGTQKWIGIAAAGVAAFLLVFAAVAKVIIFMGRLRMAMIALRATAIPTWLALLGPIALVIAAIAAVVAIIVILWKKSETFRTVVTSVWNAIKTATIATWNAIRGFLTSVFNTIRALVTAAWNRIRSNTQAAWNFIYNVILAPMRAVLAILRGDTQEAFAIMQNAWNMIRNATKAAWNALKAIVMAAIDNVVEDISGLKDRIMGFFSGAKDWLVNAGRDIIQGLIDGIMDMVDDVAGAVGKVTGAIGKFLPGSPVKEGPLKVLNRGYAGKEIVNMMITGIEAMARPLAEAMNDTLTPAAPAGYAAAPGARLAKPKRRGGGGRRKRATLVDGELRLDPSGRAFISGVAIEADDDDDDYDDTLGRMNR